MLGPRARAFSWRTLASAAFGVFTLAGAAPAEDRVVRPLPTVQADLGYVPDQFVVEFRRDVAHRVQALADVPGRGRANLSEVQALLDAVQARGFEREFAGSKPQPLGGKFPDLTGYYLVKLPAGSDRESAMQVFSSHADVDHVEPIGLHTIDLRPNDHRYIWDPLPQPAQWPDRQWQYMGAYGIDNEQAWDHETGDPNVVVAILDTGVKYRHADLGGANPPGPADNDTQGNIWVNSAEIPGNGIDDDGNGFVDDVVGWDFVDNVNFAGATCQDVDCGIVDNDPNDGEGHGTHLAGTVAGIANNDDVPNASNPSARGIAGVVGGFSDGTSTGAGNGCKIMVLRMGARVRIQGQLTGVVSMSWAAQAMNYVATMKDHGVNVASINCSWGSSNSGGITAAVANLVAHDVVIANAAGNSNSSVAPYLTTLPGVVAVGATDSTGAGASFTNFGTWVDIAAPGVQIISTLHDPTEPDTTINLIGLLDGTSMASPHVAAAAALLESYNSALSAQDKINLLVNHTKAFGPGNTKVLGPGILDVNLALLAAPAPVGVGDSPGSPSDFLQLRAAPNPLRTGTDLVIHARSREHLSLRILDAAGRQVRAAEGTADGSGIWRLRWDARNAAGARAGTGLYFVNVSTPSGTVSQKLVVLE